MAENRPAPTSIRIPEEEKAQIKNLADNRGIAPHDWMLRAIRRVLKAELDRSLDR